jgi:hypothetical protein
VETDPAAQNGSAIWVPTAYVTKDRFDPDDAESQTTLLVAKGVHIYYFGSDNINHTTEPFPIGLEAIAPRKPGTGILFFCGDHTGQGNAGHLPDDCDDNGELNALIAFGNCWNGDLDGNDDWIGDPGDPDSIPPHRAHLKFSGTGDCPTSHPHRVPKLTVVVSYSIIDSDADREFVSCGGLQNGPPESCGANDLADEIVLGGGHTDEGADGWMQLDAFHADYMFAWAQERITLLTHACLNSNRDCKTGGSIPLEPPYDVDP